MVPASGGIETFPFRATGLFLPAGPEVFRAVDVRRTVGVFLIFIRRLPVALDFYFGQFCSFSAQIDGVDDFNSFTVHRTIRKRFLGRVWRSQKSR